MKSGAFQAQKKKKIKQTADVGFNAEGAESAPGAVSPLNRHLIDLWPSCLLVFCKWQTIYCALSSKSEWQAPLKIHQLGEKKTTKLTVRSHARFEGHYKGCTLSKEFHLRPQIMYSAKAKAVRLISSDVTLMYNLRFLIPPPCSEGSCSLWIPAQLQSAEQSGLSR